MRLLPKVRLTPGRFRDRRLFNSADSCSQGARCEHNYQFGPAPHLASRLSRKRPSRLSAAALVADQLPVRETVPPLRNPVFRALLRVHDGLTSMFFFFFNRIGKVAVSRGFLSRPTHLLRELPHAIALLNEPSGPTIGDDTGSNLHLSCGDVVVCPSVADRPTRTRPRPPPQQRHREDRAHRWSRRSTDTPSLPTECSVPRWER